jgi:hypothetical protein
MSKKISDLFQVEPVSNKPSLPTILDESESDSKLDHDAELARKNMIEMLEVGNRALENAYEVAVQSESPRAYEVLSTMLKTMSDMNSQLLDIHKKRRDMALKTEESSQPRTVNNVAFVGTNAELNKIIMGRLNKS